MRDATEAAMRTTLTIDDDVLEAARAMADLEGRTMGEIISDLARKALVRPTAPKTRNGITLLPVRPDGTRATLELVNRLRDELP
jgi:hypothetical protein